MPRRIQSRSFGILEQKELVRSIVLIHGYFKKNYFDYLGQRLPKKVFVLEGRPQLASSRQACRELIQRGIKPTIISDNMAGFLFYKHLVKEVCISYQGKDNESLICPVGGLILAVLAKRHFVPVFMSPANQNSELEAKEEEILFFEGVRVAPKGIKAYGPLVDKVSRDYVTKIF